MAANFTNGFELLTKIKGPTFQLRVKSTVISKVLFILLGAIEKQQNNVMTTILEIKIW